MKNGFLRRGAALELLHASQVCDNIVNVASSHNLVVTGFDEV